MDSIIFLLLLSVLVAFGRRKHRTGLILFFVSLAATLFLFELHVTESLKLVF